MKKSFRNFVLRQNSFLYFMVSYFIFNFFFFSASAATFKERADKEGCAFVMEELKAALPSSLTEEDKWVRAQCEEDAVEAAALYRRLETDVAASSFVERQYVMGNYIVARDLLQQLLKKRLTEPKSEATVRTWEYWQALCDLAGGKWKNAETILKRLYKTKALVCEFGVYCAEVTSGVNRSRAPVLAAHARALELQRRWTEASRLLEGYFKDQDESSVRWRLELRLLLGQLYFRLQKLPQAYRQFARILKLYPQSAQANWIRERYAYNDILARFGSQATSL